MRVRDAEMALEIVTEPVAGRLTENGPITVPPDNAQATNAARIGSATIRDIVVSCSSS
jgi:hypothetical protein